jgi:cysteinyl-tRNA synthetase
MVMRFYNTLTRRKQAFMPLKKGEVRLYNCGPTVYDYAHIGNFRAYVFADLLRRYLEWKGFRVLQVMNITDVDDKTIKGSRKEGIVLSDYTKKYTEAFFRDVDTLNIKRAGAYPRATEHIKEMVKIVQALLKRGVAYRGEDGIYFSIRNFPRYGKLSETRVKNLKAGARVKQDEYDKESANDFALWKFWDKEDGDVFWETPIGKGRPGWHIECSAMSMKALGETLDIHTGGTDLIFPHHENEIAQSEAVTGKPFVRYWLHNNHLVVEGRKMSKSLGNFFTLRDLLRKGHDPLAIRFFLISGHYRARINLTTRALESAANTVRKLRSFVQDMGQHRAGKRVKGSTPRGAGRVDGIIKSAREAFEKSMDDDLGMPDALSAIFGFMSRVNKERDAGRLDRKDASKAYGFMIDVDRVLGLGLEKLPLRTAIPDEIRLMAEEREQLRREKRFREADRIREGIRKKGFVVEDTPGGPRIRKA